MEKKLIQEFEGEGIISVEPICQVEPALKEGSDPEPKRELENIDFVPTSGVQLNG